MSNGVPSESFFVGDRHSARNPELYAELLHLFPEFGDMAHPARWLARHALR